METGRNPRLAGSWVDKHGRLGQTQSRRVNQSVQTIQRETDSLLMMCLRVYGGKERLKPKTGGTETSAETDELCQ